MAPSVPARLLIGIVVLCVLSAACGGASPADVSAPAVTATCDANEGTWTYLHDEFVGARNADDIIEWAVDGCAINTRYVYHRYGDPHCDLGAFEYLSIGLPVGTPFSGDDASPPGQDWEPEFVFNTDGAWESDPPGRTFAFDEIPTEVVDVGIRGDGGRRMWIAADESAVYVVRDGVAQEFVLPDDVVACA